MHRDCLVCGGDASEALFEKEGIPYHRCPNCDFAFSTPTTNANFATALDDYEPAYLAYLETSAEDEANFAAQLRWVEGFRSLRGHRVVDVGAGGGKLVRFLRSQDVDCHGIEPAKPLYEHFLRDDPCFSAETLDEFADRASEPLDAVLAFDVLEHVERPDLFFASAARVLGPDGMLFVSTPDRGSVLARLTRRRWHYYNKYHLSYFSRSTLGALARGHAFEERGFARLGRRKSVGYVMQYFVDFVLGGSLRVPRRLERLLVPINLHDTMYVAFARRAPEFTLAE